MNEERMKRLATLNGIERVIGKFITSMGFIVIGTLFFYERAVTMSELSSDVVFAIFAISIFMFCYMSYRVFDIAMFREKFEIICNEEFEEIQRLEALYEREIDDDVAMLLKMVVEFGLKDNLVGIAVAKGVEDDE